MFTLQTFSNILCLLPFILGFAERTGTLPTACTNPWPSCVRGSLEAPVIRLEFCSKALKMNEFWYALHVNSRCQGALQSAIPSLGFDATTFAPTRVTERKIASRPGPIRSRVLAFSNYLLVRFEMTGENFQKIIGLHGCYGFVRFGDNPPVAIPQRQIDKLNEALDAFTKGPVVIGGDEQDRLLHLVVSEHSPAARNAGFQAFLQLVERQGRTGKKSATTAPKTKRQKPARLILAY